MNSLQNGGYSFNFHNTTSPNHHPYNLQQQPTPSSALVIFLLPTSSCNHPYNNQQQSPPLTQPFSPHYLFTKPSIQSHQKSFLLLQPSSRLRLYQKFNEQKNIVSTDTVLMFHLMKMIAIRMANQPIQPFTYPHLLTSLTFPASNITALHMLLETSTRNNFHLRFSIPTHCSWPLPPYV